MVTTLRESKARLSELVELAGRGEEVLISVRGRVKARLTRVESPAHSGRRWARELSSLHRKHGAGGSRCPIDRILSELREDRV